MPEVMARKRQSGVRMQTCPSPKFMLCTDGRSSAPTRSGFLGPEYHDPPHSSEGYTEPLRGRVGRGKAKV